MDRTAAVLPLQTPIDVSIVDIQRELDKLWSSKGDSSAARAATFTLIVYESLDNTLLLPSTTVESIATQNPCRVIDLRAKVTGSELDAVDAQVAAYCPINSDKSSLICCEYITLQAPESAFVRMCSTVASLLIPDLPTFLWWQGELDLNSTLFQQLVELSHRVIVDSIGFVNPEEDLQEMDQLAREGKYTGDLNWRRLSSWQELTAQAFDPVERRQALNQIDQVTLDYKVGTPCQAFLYLGWLANRLGWEPIRRIQTVEHDYAINRFTFQASDGHTISAEVAAVPLTSDLVMPGGLIGARLTASTSSINPCTVLCSETTGCMRMETMGAAQTCITQQVSPLQSEGIDDLLEQQLQRLGRELLYEDSLAVIVKMLNCPAT